MAAPDATPDLINLSGLMDDAKCFAVVRKHRWPEGVRCPGCDTAAVLRDGCDDSQPHRRRYRCKECAQRFDDLTGAVLAGHHQPLRVWVLYLYFMGLNLSNRQIAQKLGLSGSDVQAMAEQAVAKGTRIHTDEYDIYARLPAWGYRHETVCHAHGEYARDEVGDGFCEIHVNTMVSVSR